MFQESDAITVQYGRAIRAQGLLVDEISTGVTVAALELYIKFCCCFAIDQKEWGVRNFRYPWQNS